MKNMSFSDNYKCDFTLVPKYCQQRLKTFASTVCKTGPYIRSRVPQLIFLCENNILLISNQLIFTIRVNYKYRHAWESSVEAAS